MWWRGKDLPSARHGDCKIGAVKRYRVKRCNVTGVLITYERTLGWWIIRVVTIIHKRVEPA